MFFKISSMKKVLIFLKSLKRLSLKKTKWIAINILVIAFLLIVYYCSIVILCLMKSCGKTNLYIQYFYWPACLHTYTRTNLDEVIYYLLCYQNMNLLPVFKKKYLIENCTRKNVFGQKKLIENLFWRKKKVILLQSDKVLFDFLHFVF